MVLLLESLPEASRVGYILTILSFTHRCKLVVFAAAREAREKTICRSGDTVHKVICGPEDFHINKKDKGIHVRVPDGPRCNSKFRRKVREPVTTLTVPKFATAPDTQECTNPPSRDEVLSSPRSSVLSTTGTISSSTVSQDERIRVECDACGYA